MTAKRGKGFSTTLDKDARIELTRLAKSSKYNGKFIASHAIMQIAKLDMLNPNWEPPRKELEDARAKENRYESLDKSCPALCFIDDHFECRWGREGKSPDMKRIGKTIEAVNEGCAACKNTIDLNAQAMNMEKRWTQILVKDEGLTFTEHTYCAKGSEFNEKTGKVHCLVPDIVSKKSHWEDQEFCSELEDGKGCIYLRTLPARRIKKTGIRRR